LNLTLTDLVENNQHFVTFFDNEYGKLSWKLMYFKALDEKDLSGKIESLMISLVRTDYYKNAITSYK